MLFCFIKNQGDEFGVRRVTLITVTQPMPENTLSLLSQTVFQWNCMSGIIVSGFLPGVVPCVVQVHHRSPALNFTVGVSVYAKVGFVFKSASSQTEID